MTDSIKYVGIIGMGMAIPEKVITNFDLEKTVGTTNEWIVQRTGIEKRHVLGENQPGYTIGIKAAKQAIANAKLQPTDIDLIIVSSYVTDYFCPTTACIIQGEIGATNAASFDMNVGCTGFIYATVVAQQFILSGKYKNVLIVSVESNSKVLDWQDKRTCVLFGDGAGAAVLSEVPERYGIIDTFLASDGRGKNLITVPNLHFNDEDMENRDNQKKRTIWVNGNEVFKFAVKVMEEATNSIINKANIKSVDIDLIIPHQANIRIIEGSTKRLKISKEKVFKNVHKYGNMASASIPVAIKEAMDEGKLKDGNYVVLVGFGGGLNWGAILLKWYKGSE